MYMGKCVSGDIFTIVVSEAIQFLLRHLFGPLLQSRFVCKTFEDGLLRGRDWLYLRGCGWVLECRCGWLVEWVWLRVVTLPAQG